MSRLPPAEKLSLALRKNVRDEYEAKRADFEKQLSDALGTPWTIDINPNAIWPYAKEGYAKDSIGSCISSYVDGAIYQLKYFGERQGEEGLKELNDICHEHVLTMDLDEDKKFSYCGGIVSDGKLVLVFNRDNLGTNASYALEEKVLLQALNEAPPATGNDSKLSHSARTGIRQEYDPKIEEVREKMAKMLARPEFKFSPNFEDAFEKLAAEKKRKGNSLDDAWESRLGYYTFSYFDGLQWMMNGKNFGDDDMLQEGFNEAVEKGEVAFRIVDKLKYGSYCEVVVEDGVLYVQTLADKWGSNATYAAEKIIDQL